MWTKSQKISGAVLALAAGAFAIDRFVLDRPAGTEATHAPTAPLASRTPARSAGPAVAKAAAAPAANASMTLANRLAALGESRRFSYEPAGDAFRPSTPWLATVKPPETKTPTAVAPAPKPAPKKVDYAALFRSRHTLNAVMSKQGGGMAIVNGKLYAPGQTIDGYMLKTVGDAEATFSGNGTTVTIRLPNQAGAPAKGASAAAR